MRWTSSSIASEEEGGMGAGGGRGMGDGGMGWIMNDREEQC